MARARLISALVSFGLFAGLQAVTVSSAVAVPVLAVEPVEAVTPSPPPIPPTPVVGPEVVDPVAPITGPGTRAVVEPPSFDDEGSGVDIDPTGGVHQVEQSPLSLGRAKPGRVPEDGPVTPAVDAPGRVRFTNVKGEALVRVKYEVSRVRSQSRACRISWTSCARFG